MVLLPSVLTGMLKTAKSILFNSKSIQCFAILLSKIVLIAQNEIRFSL